MAWLLIASGGILVWGLLSLFYQPFYKWSTKRQLSLTQKDYLFIRYIYPGSSFIVLGAGFFFDGLGKVFNHLLPILWPSLLLLFVAIIFLIFATLLIISTDFNVLFWKYVWYQDINTDKKWMSTSLFAVGLSLLFGVYLFSGIFIVWP